MNNENIADTHDFELSDENFKKLRHFQDAIMLLKRKTSGHPCDPNRWESDINASFVLVGSKPTQCYIHYIRNSLKRGTKLVFLIAAGCRIEKARIIERQLVNIDHVLYRYDEKIDTGLLSDSGKNVKEITITLTTVREMIDSLDSEKGHIEQYSSTSRN